MFERSGIFSILSSPLQPLEMEIEVLLSESDRLAQHTDTSQLLRLPNDSFLFISKPDKASDFFLLFLTMSKIV